MISIDQQIQAIAEVWPEFKLTHRKDQSATWEGVMAPDGRKHRVRVRYRVPNALEDISLKASQPLVQVIDPVLEWHEDYADGPVPHVYFDRKDILHPYLCLFSVELRQWSPADLLAETTLFWTYEWLYFYEGWLAIHSWRGGGRHPTPESTDEGVKLLEPAPV